MQGSTEIATEDALNVINAVELMERWQLTNASPFGVRWLSHLVKEQVDKVCRLFLVLRSIDEVGSDCDRKEIVCGWEPQHVLTGGAI